MKYPMEITSRCVIFTRFYFFLYRLRRVFFFTPIIFCTSELRRVGLMANAEEYYRRVYAKFLDSDGFPTWLAFVWFLKYLAFELKTLLNRIVSIFQFEPWYPAKRRKIWIKYHLNRYTDDGCFNECFFSSSLFFNEYPVRRRESQNRIRFEFHLLPRSFGVE